MVGERHVATIRYAGLHFELCGDPALQVGIAAEIEPFFEVRPRDGSPEPLLRLELLGSPPRWLHELVETSGAAVAVDTSLYKHLASSGTRWELPSGHVVRIDATGSLFVFETASRLVRLYQDDRALVVRDAVRAIKGLCTAAVERAGGIQIHCSGGVSAGRAFLLMGDMWQGKTTVLLELLDQFDVGMLSCDTVVLLPDAHRESGLLVSGWPSPFSVSHGTLSDHAPLHEFFPPERRGMSYTDLWREGKKSVLTSQHVVDRFATRIVPQADDVAVCLLLRYAPAEATHVSPIQSAGDLAGHLQTVYLGSRDPIYHNWHQFINCGADVIEANIQRIAEALFARTENYVVTWAPSITSLMKTIPTLARSHRTLGPLLFR